MSSGARPPRFLVVVAHPDDETFGCGSLLLHAAALGATTFVACATRGEVGEPAPGSGVTQDQLAAVRETELHEASRLLGVSRVELLGFVDSGLTGPSGPETLVGAPFEEVRDRVRQVIDDIEPDILLTLDGSDGHRDHLRIAEAAIAAATTPGSPVTQIYQHCVPRSWIQPWLEEQARQNPTSPYLEIGAIGTPDELINAVLDMSAYYDVRERAIAAHRSQVSPFDVLDPDDRRSALSSDYLRRVLPPWPEGRPPADTMSFTVDD